MYDFHSPRFTEIFLPVNELQYSDLPCLEFNSTAAPMAVCDDMEANFALMTHPPGQFPLQGGGSSFPRDWIVPSLTATILFRNSFLLLV